MQLEATNKAIVDLMMVLQNPDYTWNEKALLVSLIHLKRVRLCFSRSKSSILWSFLFVIDMKT